MKRASVSPSKGTKRTPFAILIFFAGLKSSLGMLWDGLIALDRWLRSEEGIVFWCITGVALVLGVLYVAQTQLLEQDAALAEEEAGPQLVQESENPIVARIGREVVRLSDVRAFAIQEGRLTEADELDLEAYFERGLVDALIDQRLLAAAALRNGVSAQPEVASRLRTARNRILSSAYLNDVIAKNATEENARALYEAQQESMRFGDEVRLQHMIVESVEQAVALANDLNNGAEFDELASTFSLDVESRARGGDLGFFTQAQMPAEYIDKVADLKPGDVVSPFQTDKGWVILKVRQRRSVAVPSYRSVRPELLEFLKLRAVNSTLEALRDEAAVALFPPMVPVEEEGPEETEPEDG
jgi:peptidyl-prolyl cis-trans isomerase C